MYIITNNNFLGKNLQNIYFFVVNIIYIEKKLYSS